MINAAVIEAAAHHVISAQMAESDIHRERFKQQQRAEDERKQHKAPNMTTSRYRAIIRVIIIIKSYSNVA